jgi:hypothetical protein
MPFQQALQTLIFRRRRVQRFSESLAGLFIDHKQPLVEQHLACLPTRCFQHKFKPVLTCPLCSSINQGALGTIGAKVNGDIPAATSGCLGVSHFDSPVLKSDYIIVYVNMLGFDGSTALTRHAGLPALAIRHLIKCPKRFGDKTPARG